MNEIMRRALAEPRSNFLPSLSMALMVNISSNTTFEAAAAMVVDEGVENLESWSRGWTF